MSLCLKIYPTPSSSTFLYPECHPWSLFQRSIVPSSCKEWPPPDILPIYPSKHLSPRRGQHQLSPLWWQCLLSAGKLTGKESIVQVHVEVLDENDNAPEFAQPYDPRVCENAVQGKVSLAEWEGDSVPGDRFKGRVPLSLMEGATALRMYGYPILQLEKVRDSWREV